MDSPDENTNLTDDIRGRIRESLHSALRSRTNTLIVAPTGIGKTHEIATTNWSANSEVIGTPLDLGTPIIHISPSRDARDQAHEKSQEAGVDAHTLKGRQEVCPVARGDYDDHFTVYPDGQTPSAWFDLKCEVQGIPFSTAHDDLEKKQGGLPCSTDDACEGAKQWIPMFDGSANEFDIVHATDTFVYNTDLIRNRHVVFDEQPRYLKQVNKHVTDSSQIGRILTHAHIQDSVTEFLQTHAPNEPIATWEGLMAVQNVDDQEILDNFKRIVEEAEFDQQYYLNSPFLNVSTPTLIRAIINAKDVGNGYRRGEAEVRYEAEWHDSESHTAENSRTITVVFDDSNDIKLIHEPPNLSPARTVIGFDAHPTERLWRANTVSDLKVDDLGLTTEELREWRKAERGLTVYQIGEATRPFTKGWAGDTAAERQRTKDRADAIIQELHQRYGAEFRTAITTKDLEEEVKTMMQVAGVVNPESMHYGETHSRNDFGGESVGLLIGCIDPGDENILTRLALLNLTARPCMVETESGEIVREVGRTFSGPDADAATEMLESVREMEVAQAIGRYARDADTHDSRATVYTWSSAIPEALLDGIVPGVEDLLIGKQKEIVKFLSATDGWATKHEIVDGVVGNSDFDSVSEEQVRKTVTEWEGKGMAKINKGGGYNGADEYSMERGTNTSVVDLSTEE